MGDEGFTRGGAAGRAGHSYAPIGGVSQVAGPAAPALTDATLPQMLLETVARHGDAPALVSRHQGVRRTYAELSAEVDRLAAGLLSLGLGKGDRLGIWSPNRHEWILTQLATARIGVILVNINPAYRTSEVEYALNASGCAALVLAERFKTSDYVAMIRELAPELDRAAPGQLRAERLPHLRWLAVIGGAETPGMLRFDDLLAAATEPLLARLPGLTAALSPDEAINIQFTSGTTGAPKGATLTHRNIANNARFVTDRINLTSEDRLCLPVPLYHCFGMVMGVLGAIDKGAAMLLPADGFDAETTLACLAEERCTAVYGVPTMFVAMLERLGEAPRDLSSLRTGIMAGSPCPVEVMRRVEREMNMGEVTICYGMTETSPVSFQSFVDDPLELRCETVGRVHPHLEVKIVDEAGAVVPVGAQGELCTRGYSVMQGYWEDAENTAASIREGWMHTGDLATLDAEGFCRITGRVKDMIIRGGENIYPREIEEFLFRQPGIAQAQVFGIPDDVYGEVVCAWVVPARGAALTEESVRAACDGKIARFKVPAHVRIVEEIPMTVTGKPQKFIMRDKMLEMLGRSA